jgi:hypothetical protein
MNQAGYAAARAEVRSRAIRAEDIFERLTDVEQSQELAVRQRYRQPQAGFTDIGVVLDPITKPLRPYERADGTGAHHPFDIHI